MTQIVFNSDLVAQFKEFMNEAVDWGFDGTPILRRTTMNEATAFAMEFGWMAHAAWVAAHKDG